jgi:hypothetical protein
MRLGGLGVQSNDSFKEADRFRIFAETAFYLPEQSQEISIVGKKTNRSVQEYFGFSQAALRGEDPALFEEFLCGRSLSLRLNLAETKDASTD